MAFLKLIYYKIQNGANVKPNGYLSIKTLSNRSSICTQIVRAFSRNLG
jgi:hypothetical protein